jgi:hypothetical protein
MKQDVNKALRIDAFVRLVMLHILVFTFFIILKETGF